MTTRQDGPAESLPDVAGCRRRSWSCHARFSVWRSCLSSGCRAGAAGVPSSGGDLFALPATHPRTPVSFRATFFTPITCFARFCTVDVSPSLPRQGFGLPPAAAHVLHWSAPLPRIPATPLGRIDPRLNAHGRTCPPYILLLPCLYRALCNGCFPCTVNTLLNSLHQTASTCGDECRAALVVSIH